MKIKVTGCLFVSLCVYSNRQNYVVFSYGEASFRSREGLLLFWGVYFNPSNGNQSAFSQNGFLNRKYINTQYFLKVPRHMRRRAVAHDVMRLPRRLRYWQLKKIKLNNVLPIETSCFNNLAMLFRESVHLQVPFINKNKLLGGHPIKKMGIKRELKVFHGSSEKLSKNKEVSS